VHAERGAIVDQFYAERLYSRQRICELLDRASFDCIRDNGMLRGESTRN